MTLLVKETADTAGYALLKRYAVDHDDFTGVEHLLDASLACASIPITAALVAVVHSVI